MNLQDSLFNWLQISVVAAARPDDNAARETKDFFELILREDHGLTHFEYQSEGEVYVISYEAAGSNREQKIDRELVEQLLVDINSNPKYNE